MIRDYIDNGGSIEVIREMFVSTDNSFAYANLNKFLDNTLTHKAVHAEIEELTGGKILRFGFKGDTESEDYKHTLAEFKRLYEHGKYEIPVFWIEHMYAGFGEVLKRSDVLSHIAKQHPPRQQSSFMPSNDKNLYEE